MATAVDQLDLLNAFVIGGRSVHSGRCCQMPCQCCHRGRSQHRDSHGLLQCFVCLDTTLEPTHMRFGHQCTNHEFLLAIPQSIAQSMRLGTGPSTFVMYYTARYTTSGKQCVSYAVSTTGPAGPFVDNSTSPWLCQLAIGGSIDPSPFVDPANNQTYLVWKNDGNCCGDQVNIWAQALAPNGTTLLGQPQSLIGVVRHIHCSHYLTDPIINPIINPIQSNPIQTSMQPSMQSNHQSKPIINPIQYNPIQSNPIINATQSSIQTNHQCNAMQCNQLMVHRYRHKTGKVHWSKDHR